MITRIQALNYRGLRYVDVPLDRFHILVGANASGKSTLLDVVSFVGDFVRNGLEEAIDRRSENFQDLVWSRPREELGFELALEFEIPESLRELLPKENGFHTYRYEIAVREIDDRPHVHCERGILISGQPTQGSSQTLPRSSFPNPPCPPETILTGDQRDSSSVVTRRDLNYLILIGERPTLIHETPFHELVSSVAVDPLVSHFGFLDPPRFPVSSYVHERLNADINYVFLDSRVLRDPSSVRMRSEYLSPSGAALPWAVKHVRENERDTYDSWLEDIKIVIEDLDDIRVVFERKEERRAYLILKYRNGVELPASMVSDGTLRLLAIMLVAYMVDEDEILLLDEPENGVHPLALQSVYGATSSAYGSQVIMATHSPALLSLASPEQVLCIAKDREGTVDIIRGDQHPMVREWRGAVDMNMLFAQGVFG